MSPEHRYLNFALIVSVLFLMFAPNAGPRPRRNNFKVAWIASSKFSGPSEARKILRRNRNSLRRSFWSALILRQWQGSLGTRWNDLKGKEEEFVSVFTDFVEHSYMSTLGSYRGEKIVYDHDRSDGESAEVDTRVVGGEGNPIKIEYKPPSHGWTADGLRCGYR